MATERIKDGMRLAVAWALLLVLIIAPLAISLTHGPGPFVGSTQVAVANAAHGHSHDWDEPRKPVQHDATDHEHSFATVLAGDGGSIYTPKSADLKGEPRLSAGVSGEGLRRPPRDSTV